jgi:hypothetical protein
MAALFALTRSSTVGTKGVLGGNARVEGVKGVWNELTNNVPFPRSFVSHTADICGFAGEPNV